MADVSRSPPAQQPPSTAEKKGPALYKHAKTLIPGGTGLLSKRPELYLPEQWPAYYSRAVGCSVWDLDGRQYTDMLCTPGCFVLGAADPDVNEAVVAAVHAGSFSSLNAPEEVELSDAWVSCGLRHFTYAKSVVNFSLIVTNTVYMPSDTWHNIGMISLIFGSPS